MRPTCQLPPLRGNERKLLGKVLYEKYLPVDRSALVRLKGFTRKHHVRNSTLSVRVKVATKQQLRLSSVSGQLSSFLDFVGSYLVRLRPAIRLLLTSC